MSHKHCVFCGEELPVPRPSNWNSVCESPANTGPADTVGNRHHAFLVGRKEKYNFAEPQRERGGGSLSPREWLDARYGSTPPVGEWQWTDEIVEAYASSRLDEVSAQWENALEYALQKRRNLSGENLYDVLTTLYDTGQNWKHRVAELTAQLADVQNRTTVYYEEWKAQQAENATLRAEVERLTKEVNP